MVERAGIGDTLREVKDRLKQMHGDLQALSRAIWEDIDHDDPSRLEEGVRYKQRYNERRVSLEEDMGAMLALLRDYPRSDPGTGAEAPTEEEASEQVAEQRAPIQPPPVSASPLVGSLEHKAPFGFVLGGQTFTSASAWPLFYEALLQELYGRAPEIMSRLADTPGEFELAGRPLFARVPDRLDDPLPIADTIFAEADLDPPVLLQVVKGLILEMGYPLDSLKILLKETKRGTVETLSIAA